LKERIESRYQKMSLLKVLKDINKTLLRKSEHERLQDLTRIKTYLEEVTKDYNILKVSETGQTKRYI
jgi:hypothetical protein